MPSQLGMVYLYPSSISGNTQQPISLFWRTVVIVSFGILWDWYNRLLICHYTDTQGIICIWYLAGGTSTVEGMDPALKKLNTHMVLAMNLNKQSAIFRGGIYYFNFLTLTSPASFFSIPASACGCSQASVFTIYNKCILIQGPFEGVYVMPVS